MRVDYQLVFSEIHRDLSEMYKKGGRTTGDPPNSTVSLPFKGQYFETFLGSEIFWHKHGNITFYHEDDATMGVISCSYTVSQMGHRLVKYYLHNIAATTTTITTTTTTTTTTTVTTATTTTTTIIITTTTTTIVTTTTTSNNNVFECWLTSRGANDDELIARSEILFEMLGR